MDLKSYITIRRTVTADKLYRFRVVEVAGSKPQYQHSGEVLRVLYGVRSRSPGAAERAIRKWIAKHPKVKVKE